MIEDGRKLQVLKAESNDRYKRKRPGDNGKNYPDQLALKLEPKCQYFIVLPNGIKTKIVNIFQNQTLYNHEKKMCLDANTPSSLTIAQLGLTFDFKSSEAISKDGEINKFEKVMNPNGVEVNVMKDQEPVQGGFPQRNEKYGSIWKVKFQEQHRSVEAAEKAFTMNIVV